MTFRLFAAIFFAVKRRIDETVQTSIGGGGKVVSVFIRSPPKL